MSVVEKRTVTFRCDACGHTAESNSGLPRGGGGRAWARLKWQQDAGFDYHGSAWCNRVAGPGHIDLCSTCADEVMAVIERKREVVR